MTKKLPSDVRLEQLLESLSAELAETTDAELLDACDDLGIKPGMKGSIAFLGLKGLYAFPYNPQKLAPGTDANLGASGDDDSDLTRRQ